MTIALLAILVCGALLWLRQRRNFLDHLRHVERILDDIAAGRQPSHFVFRNARDLAGLPWRLEHLSDEYDVLRKQVEERKSDLDAILASMTEGVLMVSERHVIRMVNHSFREMFGLADDPLGHTILQTLREIAVDRLVSEALENGGVRSREISLAGRSSETRFFSVNAIPINKAPGGAQAVVAVFHDVSRLHQLENMRREFVANVSHELRTPLSIFQGHLENLLDDPELAKGDVAHALQTMDRHSRRLNALLDDLLQLARLEGRREKLQICEVRLDAFLRELVPDWQQKLEQKRMTLAVEVPTELPPICADPRRLEQILGNLLDNAIKFGGENGVVTISAVTRDGAVEIAVRDNGIGIPPGDLPHIFERFYRVEKGRSRDAGGTGLGLSIVKHIVALHGGSVRAESPGGIGTAILFTLPPASGASEND
ncbi:MAG: two-component system, OmpR family, phosphate regulon sensor histidine kinase PhoR [Chthoniobacter sp.]|nr:two-component system, OmpR family, phosphate regulon sensor histidine kinase PhoR [Chthoniobacter sp.]